MKAIETSGKVDARGNLKLNKQLRLKKKDVKVIILYPEQKDDEEKEWLTAIASNPAFTFLNDEGEDIYSITDGKPFNG
ncbi:MAG: hypothetical protein ABIO46_06160 [Chitinophagales bacterium]